MCVILSMNHRSAEPCGISGPRVYVDFGVMAESDNGVVSPSHALENSGAGAEI